MYPVRTTLLLTVDESTAKRFLREESIAEQPEGKPPLKCGRLTTLIRKTLHGTGHVLLALGERLDQDAASSHATRMGAAAPGE